MLQRLVVKLMTTGCLSILTLNSVIAQVLVPELPSTLYNYANPALPAHFNNNNIQDADNTPGFNPVTNAGATLGRVLFYDKRLSANNTIACSSCHLQSDGFSDPDQFSTGFQGGLTPRHSMSLSNARFYERGRFFWDERAQTLEDQTLQPIQDPIEMGLDLGTLESRLQGTSFYPALFQSAFGTTTVDRNNIANALAQFIRSMVSYQSRYDQGVATNFANFTQLENQGRQLFNSGRTQCSNCHETDLQIMDQPRNNGLDAVTTDEGAGNGRFKSPSLRNIALSPPYMHDGRFETLEDVVNFYNSGIQNNPDLDNRLRQNGQPRRMNLTQNEQAALVAFMETLTDDAFIADVKFSDPFVVQTSISPTTLSGILQLLLE